MINEDLQYWYDENKNKVYGDKKKYNKKFEYLISDDPNDVVSYTGLKLRQIISPVFRSIVSLTSKNKFCIEKKEALPKKRPIIFASTHGFRDDIALAIKTAGVHGYILYGSIPDFYYSIDGKALWANGSIIIDRKDKKNRASAIPKMEHVINMGGNIIMCPEGVWNKSENLLVLKLYRGIYELAKRTNAIVVPISSLQDSNVCYSKRMAAIDIAKYEEKEGLRLLRDSLATGKWQIMEEHCHIKREEIGDTENYWKTYLNNLIKTSNGLYDYEIENSAEYKDKNIFNEKEVFDIIDDINVDFSNAYVFSKTSNKFYK